jgi:hypothetical protein
VASRTNQLHTMKKGGYFTSTHGQKRLLYFKQLEITTQQVDSTAVCKITYSINFQQVLKQKYTYEICWASFITTAFIWLAARHSN